MKSRGGSKLAACLRKAKEGSGNHEKGGHRGSRPVHKRRVIDGVEWLCCPKEGCDAMYKIASSLCASI